LSTKDLKKKKEKENHHNETFRKLNLFSYWDKVTNPCNPSFSFFFPSVSSEQMGVSALSGWLALAQLGWCVGFSMNPEASFLSSSRLDLRRSATISPHTSSCFPPSVLLGPAAARASSTQNVALSMQSNPGLGPKNPGLGLCVIKHRLKWLSMSFSLSPALSLFLTL